MEKRNYSTPAIETESCGVSLLTLSINGEQGDGRQLGRRHSAQWEEWDCGGEEDC